MRIISNGSKSRRGMTVVEVLVCLLLVAILAIAGGAVWVWAFSGCKEGVEKASAVESALADSGRLSSLAEKWEGIKEEFTAIKKRREEARKELDEAEAEYEALRKKLFDCGCEEECCETCSGK